MTVLEYILKETNTKSITDLKAKLKSIAKKQYGTSIGEIKTSNFRVFYTSNPNHFCTYAISLNGIGMTNTLALDKQSFTKAGLQRGCGNYYLTTKQLNVELHQQWLK